MAHLSEGTLRRMYDDPDAKVGADAAHLEGCAECQERLKTVSEDARSIATLLAVPDAQVDVSRAFARVTSEPKAQPRLGLRFPILRPVARPTLALVAAVTALLLVGVAIAQSGLLYRPTQVQAVPITLSDVQALSQLADYGTFAWTTEPQLDVTDTPPTGTPKVGKLPAGVSTTVTYATMTQAVATFTFSASKAAATAAARGEKLPAMPKGMDGATLTVTVGPAVGEVYGNLNDVGKATSPTTINLPQLIVAKTVSPTVSASQVTAIDLENYVLKLPGVSAELKKTITAIGDPTKTLFIPVPVEYGTSQSITVQGVSGVALGDNTGVGSAVVWVKNGHTWAVAGSIKLTDAENIANNLK